MNTNDKGIPYIVYEGLAVRYERAVERAWIVIILLILLLVGSNGAWLYYESQYDKSSTTIEAEQDGEGVNIVGNGDIDYGAEGEDHN